MKKNRKLLLVGTALVSELMLGGSMALSAVNANASNKFPQLDNPNWKQVESHQHDHPSRYTNYKGEGLVDYGNPETAWSANTLFFTAIQQPYSQVSKEKPKYAKEDHQFYAGIRGNYFTYIINKGKSVTMKNVNDPYTEYNSKNKNQFYRSNTKNYVYVFTKPVKGFTTKHFTKGTMKYNIPAGTMAGNKKVVNDKGNYSMNLGNFTMPYENVFATTNKKFVRRFNSMNDWIKYMNSHPAFRNHLNKLGKEKIQTQKKYMKLR